MYEEEEDFPYLFSEFVNVFWVRVMFLVSSSLGLSRAECKIDD